MFSEILNVDENPFDHIFDIFENNNGIINEYENKKIKECIYFCCLDPNTYNIYALEKIFENYKIINFSAKEIYKITLLLSYHQIYENNITENIINIFKYYKNVLKQYIDNDINTFLTLLDINHNDIEPRKVKYNDIKIYYRKCILFKCFDWYLTPFVAIIYSDICQKCFIDAYIEIFGQSPKDELVNDIENLCEEYFYEMNIYN